MLFNVLHFGAFREPLGGVERSVKTARVLHGVDQRLHELEAGDVFNATSTEGFHIPPRAGAGVSAAAKAFVVSAMRAHPSERPTAAKLEAHAWLRPGGALDMAALGAALPG